MFDLNIQALYGDWDITRDRLHMSDELHRILSIDRENFKGFHEEFMKFVHPDDRSRVKKVLNEGVNHFKPFTIEYRLLNPDKSIRILRNEALVILDDNGQPVRMVGKVEDITEQKQKDTQLKLLLAGIEQTQDSVIITDVDGKIQYVNPAYERITGFSKDEAIGRRPSITKSGKQSKDFYEKLWSTILKGDIWSGELINKSKSGVLYNEEMTIAPVKNSDDNVVNFIAIRRDITEKKALEEKLEKLRNEYEAFMRHELKNLITPINLCADIMLRMGEKKADKYKKCAGLIMDQVARINYLVDNLKTLQDFENGGYELNKTSNNLKEVLDKAVLALQQPANRSNVAIEFVTDGNSPLAKMDANLFHGVFYNLIKNSIEHVENLEEGSEKTVKIRLTNTDDKISLSINNKGTPIPPEKLKLFFEKFNTDRNVKRNGTGLGTTYAYLVVKAHGGDISVSSNEEEGTTVTIGFDTIQPQGVT